MRKTAQVLSLLFHPVWLPAFALLLSSQMDICRYNLPLRYVCIALTALFMVVVPVLLYLLMLRFKVVTTLDASNANERRWPYVLTAFCYLLLFNGLLSLGAHPLYLIMSLGGFAIIFCLFFVNIRYKISAHAAGMGAFVAGVLGSCYLFHACPIVTILGILILSGLVCSARLYLNAHTLGQVLWGWTVGFWVFLLVFVLVSLWY